jgi:ATP synthase F1, gamma subunit
MASLKEIKGRIKSVKSTQKITSAMKMISSAKLHKAQNMVENFLPYEQQLTRILGNYLAAEETYTTPLAERREEIRRVTLVAVTSNSSLCGAFNSNIIGMFAKTYKEYLSQNVEVEIYAIGKKIDDNIRKNYQGVELRNGFNALIEKPEFSAAKAIVDTIISDFLAKRTDKVHFLYNHFKTTSVQVPTDETFLPVSLDGMGTENSLNADYIVEPSQNELLDVLLPKSLRTKFYSILLDSAAAEQAARMVAMQIATDNAEDLLKELSIQFNKQRQQAITSELLDIVGGSEALK